MVMINDLGKNHQWVVKTWVKFEESRIYIISKYLPVRYLFIMKSKINNLRVEKEQNN